MSRRPAVVALLIMLVAAGPSVAQTTGSGTRAIALDTVVGVQDYFDDNGAWKTQLIVDPFGTVEVAPRLQVSIRPLIWRVMTGAWEVYVPQASIRYEFEKGSKWRIEAGKFTSPIGLGMTENRASVNDGVIWWHRGYYSYLPTIGGGAAPHALISSIYPMGIQANTSAKHWDARVAFIDRAPADFFHTADPPFRANGVVGGGVSPLPGMRIGAAAAWGRSGDANVSDPYTLINVEGEYAFGYTKISGEWTRDRFETPTGDREAQGVTVQVKQTLVPRLFVHGRATAITSPVTVVATGEVPDRTSWYADTTLGYLVNPETTVRLAHTAIRRWNVPDVDNQVGVSIVWAKRWW
jgi:hypothetical protein